MEQSSDFRMNFEFQYNALERKRIDRLNMPFSVGPGKFALLWTICFVPTVICLLWLKMWSIVIAGGGLVILASLVPAFSRLRASKPEEFDRQIQFSAIGKKEVCGATSTFVKWNHIDEVNETADDFLFSRNQRYSLLPKRLISEEQIDDFRMQIAAWRNQPAEATVPLKMYRELFQQSDRRPEWAFELARGDLVAAVRSTVRRVNEIGFSMQDVEASNRSKRWLKILCIGLLLKLALLLILSSLPPNGIAYAPLVVLMCLSPIVLLFGMSFLLPWRAIRAVPRFHDQSYSIRLFDGGWAIGNEDLCAFNGWNQRSSFYLSAGFVGIRTDLGLIHVIPKRVFDSNDDIWRFLNQAIRLKKDWLSRKYRQETHSQNSEVANNTADELAVPGNPYRSPSVSS